MNHGWSKRHGEAFEGAAVLVTGGAGFIGSHLTEALLELGADVRVIDDLSGGDWSNVDAFDDSEAPGVKRITASILDEAALSEAMADCRYVFHQAALGSVPGSIDDPQTYFDVNVRGTVNVLETARRIGVRRVMFAASAAAYGDDETLPKREDMPPLPISPYASNKVSCETLMRAWARSFDLDAVALRYFNIFGPRQNANSAYAAVIAAFAKALGADQPPTIFGDGEQTRDFCFVRNVVHANLLAARHDRTLGGGIVNIATGVRISVNQLAREMAHGYERPDLQPTYVEQRAGDVKHSQADITRARRTLGYEPIVDFETGLAETVAWYRQMPSV